MAKQKTVATAPQENESDQTLLVPVEWIHLPNLGGYVLAFSNGILFKNKATDSMIFIPDAVLVTEGDSSKIIGIF